MDEILKQIAHLNDITNTPFYQKVDFWISSLIGIIGIIFSYEAYIEAKKAKDAAKEAGKFVKIQSLTIELTEIIQRLDSMDSEIDYQSARDFYNEINRRVRRITSPYINEEKYKKKIEEIIDNLMNIKKGMDGVRPINKDEDSNTGITVYYAVEGHFSNLSGALAELSGLFEQNTINN